MDFSLRGFCRLVSCAASSIRDVCESRHDHHGDNDGAADESKVRRMFHWGVRNRQLTLSTSFPDWTGAAHPISDASFTGSPRCLPAVCFSVAEGPSMPQPPDAVSDQ